MAMDSGLGSVEAKISNEIGKILREKLKFENVENVSVKFPEELKGEHFATETVYVQVKFNGGETQNLFLKIPSDNESHQKIMREIKVMEKECAFYSQFLPAAQKFCTERGCGNILDFFPPCLYADNDMVLLKNLVLDEGFEMLPKLEQQDFESAEMVLSNLAKFHAVSYAMIQEATLNEFKQRWSMTVTDFLSKHDLMDSFFTNGPQFCLDILKANPTDGSAEAVRYLAEYSKTVTGKIGKIAENSLEANLVSIGHGDCWNNNMLFKKDPKSGKLLKNVLVDLQCTTLASPVLDITTFLFSSVKASVRREFHTKFLQHYFANFQETLKTLNCSSTVGFEEFMADYRRFCEHGFLTGLMCLTAMEAMEGADVEDMTKTDDEGVFEFNRRIEKWIAANPGKGAEIAVEIVLLVNEYRNLVTNGIK